MHREEQNGRSCFCFLFFVSKHKHINMHSECKLKQSDLKHPFFSDDSRD